MSPPELCRHSQWVIVKGTMTFCEDHIMVRTYATTREGFAAHFQTARERDSRVTSATSPLPAEATGANTYTLVVDDQTGDLYGTEVVVGGYVLHAGEDTCQRVDLRHVFGPGYGGFIVRDAIRSGAEALDCFDGFLPAFYASHGFAEYAREANWTEGEPDVVFMALPGLLAGR